MRCRYCNKRLNLFKSLGGSSFCSQEHQKLYEEAEANKGFERLLQFVEKDPKSGPSKPSAAPASSPFIKPDKQDAPLAPPAAPVPPAPPVLQTIAAKAPDPSLEPPAPEPSAADPSTAGFLLEPIAPVATNSGSVNPNFEIPEGGFSADPAALPSYRFAIAATALEEQPSGALEDLPDGALEDLPSGALDELSSGAPDELPDGAPPPLASWLTSTLNSTLNPALSAIDAAAVSVEVSSVGSVRPRGIDLSMPLPDNRLPTPGGPPPSFVSDAPGLQLAIQAVFDTRGFANLARLNPLPREVRAAGETGRWPAGKSDVAVLHRASALELRELPEAKADGDVTIGMSGAMTRTGVGRNVSAPSATPPRLPVTLALSAVPRTIAPGVKSALDPAQTAILPAPLEQKVSHAPAMHWLGPEPPVASGLPRPAFATLRVDQRDRPAVVDMQGAMTRAGMARPIRKPQEQDSRSVSAIGSIEMLNQVTAAVQNTPHPPDCAISPAMRSQREFVQPVEPALPEAPAGIGLVIAPMNLSIRESDTALAVGITDAKKPADVSSPLFIPDVVASRRSFTIGINRTARKVQAQLQAKDGFRGCPISPARQALRDCRLPMILWSTETWLRSAIASVGWFHESDCCAQAFPSGTPATRLFSIRFEPESFSLDVPALAFDHTVHRQALEACEWKTVLAGKEQEALRLARSQPSRTSPLSLVTKPQPFVTPLALRHMASLNQFTSIANPAARGVTPSAAASASADEHQPIIALPHLTSSDLTFAGRLLSPAALKSPRVEPAEQNTDAGARPQPSPLRVQPASMLVLPGLSIPVGGIRWRVTRGWATVASPGLPKQGDVQVSSSAETSLSSVRSLADALRVESGVTQKFATLRLSPKPPAISLDLGAQTSAPGVLAANALPRRRGPKLPVVTSQLDDLIVAGR